MKKLIFTTAFASKILLVTLLASMTSQSIIAKERDTQTENMVLQLIGDPSIAVIENMAKNLQIKDSAIVDKVIQQVKDQLQNNIETITEIYLKEFSKKELQQIVNFFKGELGSKYSKFSANVVQNSDYMQLLTPIFAEAIQSLQSMLPKQNAPQMVEASKEIEAISSQAELDILLKENNLVVLKFYSDSCPPCKMLNGPYNELAEKNNEIKFVSANLNVAQELAKKYSVTSIPAVKIFKNGELVDEVIGYNPDKLKELITKNK